MATDVPVLVPHESVNDETVKLLRWLVEDGQHVAADQPVAEVEGSKATFEITSPRAGVIRFRAAIGEEVPVGTPLGHVRVAAGEAVTHPEVNGAPAPSPPPSPHPAPSPTLPPRAVTPPPVTAAPHPKEPATAFSPRFSAAARELIRQHNLSDEQFSDLPLVRAADVRARVPSLAIVAPALTPPEQPRVPEHTKEPQPTARGESPAEQPIRPAGPPGVGIPFDEVELPRQKWIEARYLRQGTQDALPSQVSALVPTVGLREALLRDANALSLTALVIFEVARLLRRYPRLNACHAERSARQYREVNIGFAVAGEFGLKVPVVRRSDEKTVGRVAEEVRELLAAYATDSLTPEQLAGGTFTVSDLSGEGVFALTPLIGRAQSAILGIGSEIRVGESDAFFSLTLSFDHQLTDGLHAAQFLAELVARFRHHETTLRQRSAAPTCSRCNRTLAELKKLKAHLLQTVTEGGRGARVCSSCIAGF